MYILLLRPCYHSFYISISTSLLFVLVMSGKGQVNNMSFNVLSSVCNHFPKGGSAVIAVISAPRGREDGRDHPPMCSTESLLTGRGHQEENMEKVGIIKFLTAFLRPVRT